MPVASQTVGRRERNKQEKLARIVAAASELFAQHGIDDVPTQQIADRADIGAGTLFLYAKNKGELLLLVQNTAYAEALDQGTQAAAREPHAVGAVLALVRPVVECNRKQVENGRTYLREMVFGDHEEPHHREALRIVAETETAIGDILLRTTTIGEDRAAILAHVVSAITFIAMAASVNASADVEEILTDIRLQVDALIGDTAS